MLSDYTTDLEFDSRPLKHEVRPDREQQFLGVGRSDDTVHLAPDIDERELPPDWPHSWTPSGQKVPTKDFFGFKWEAEYMHVAVGIPTLFQIVIRVDGDTKYRFGPATSVIVEVNATEIMTGVQNIYSFLGITDTLDVYLNIYGVMRSVLKDKYLRVALHIDLPGLKDGDKLSFVINTIITQSASYIYTSLRLAQESYEEGTFLAQLKKQRELLKPPLRLWESEGSSDGGWSLMEFGGAAGGIEDV